MVFAVGGRLEWEEARIISHLNGAEGGLTKGVSKELAWEEVWGGGGKDGGWRAENSHSHPN